jgi:HK97 gp10 family phage protein
MADGVNAKLVGLPEFSSRLRALGADAVKVVRSAALAVGTMYKKAAAANAPVLKKRDTRKKNPRVAGALRKAIYSARSRRKSKPGLEVVTVSVRSKGAKNSAYYWRWVEAGHLARGPGQKIKGGNRLRALTRDRLKASGAKFVPGVHYLERAFKSNQGNAITVFNGRIEKRIAKANRDLNNK